MVLHFFYHIVPLYLSFPMHNLGDKESLEKVQRRAISMISGLRSQQYEEKLRELGLCSLDERRHQLDMTQTFKILKGVDNVNKSTWFTPASEGSGGCMEQSADRHKK
jgi:hypothetical protein